MGDTAIQRIAILGFGEVGRIFGEDLAKGGIDVSSFDIAMTHPANGRALIAKARELGIVPRPSFEEAMQGAEIVMSAVTASSALQVATLAVPHLRPGQIYMDINSVSPDTKIAIERLTAPTGAGFVEGAVMAPVKPQRLKVPILLGGTPATGLAPRLKAAGMVTDAVSDRIGVASAIKMCRSIVMKGLAALAIESLFAARRYGAENAVLASFDATYPSMGWNKGLADTLVMRAVEHSRRRAAEMREVAETLRSAGLTPRMAVATAEMQDWLTAEMDAGRYAWRPDAGFSWQAVADAMAEPNAHHQ
jgi:3-hydroxyisobutyrate dehydrogenase-like beta-hydroxyacid dehydrogenase